MMTLRYTSQRWLVPVFLAVLLGGFALPAPAVRAATPLHVTSCADDGGAATLRGMIGAAAAGDTIVFDQDCMITLTQGTLSLTQNMTIDGTGHTVIVDGGGGVQVFLVNSGVTASLSTLTIQHGNEVPFLGGGIENDGTLTVTNSTVAGNSALFGGGGIENTGTLTVINSTITGNNTDFGSGAGINNGTNKTLTVTNSTISGNTAPGGNGGGIESNGTLTVTNSTIAGNSAQNGGDGIALFMQGTATLTNTIVANLPGGDLTSGAPAFTGSNNVIDDAGSAGGFADGASGNIVGHPAGLAAALANNGGPTQTLSLLAGSPAIAHGDPAVCASTTAPAGAPVAGKDQRGVARPAGVCAIGAYEPLLSLISRTVGPTAGGTAVTLTGAGLGAGATASIGGASCTNVHVVNSTTLTCTTGPHVAAVVNVVAAVSSKTGTLAGGFTYGDAAPLPVSRPHGPIGGSPSPVPGSRPAGTTGGPVPNPLPAPRP
jgi:hypothetical protein